jgi:Flp pilus assembly protein protease CpaA
MLSVHELIGIPLFIWQAASAVWDLRDRRIPVWFSLIPLISGILYFGIMVSPLGAVLLLVSILGTNLSPRIGFCMSILPAAYLLVSTYPSDLSALYAGWLLFWVLWRFGVLGGADALAGTILLVWYPTPQMLGALLTGLLVWSLGMLVTSYGTLAPLRLWVVLRQGFPVSLEGRKRHPGLGAFPLALALFLLWLRLF